MQPSTNRDASVNGCSRADVLRLLRVMCFFAWLCRPATQSRVTTTDMRARQATAGTSAAAAAAVMLLAALAVTAAVVTFATVPTAHASPVRAASVIARAASSSAAPPPPAAHSISVQQPFDVSLPAGFRVLWDDAQQRVEVLDASTSRLLWSSVPATAFVSVSSGTFTATQTFGNFAVADAPANRTMAQSIDEVVVDKDKTALHLSGRLWYGAVNGSGVAWLPYAFTFAELPHIGATHLGFTVRAGADADALLAPHAPTPTGRTPTGRPAAVTSDASTTTPNHVFLTYASAKDEAFYGFGSQYSFFNTKGRIVPILTQEQGVGRGLQPITLLVDLKVKNAGGNWATTYGAVPHYLTSSNTSLYLTNSQYCAFDLTADARVDVTVVVDPLSGVSGAIILGDSPADIVSQYTLYSGRMAPLPQWAAGGGAIVGYEGGTQAVVDHWHNLSAAQVPLAAFWLQDWTGERQDSFGTRLWWNWEVDEQHYPQWGALLHNLSAAGVRVLTYINPLLSDGVASKPHHRRNLFAEASAAGYLVRNASGQPYIQSSGSATFTFGTVDFTNPEAQQWYADVIRCNMLRVGSDPQGQPCAADGFAVGAAGWMSDFGEYVPFDAMLANGDAPSVHNAYPGMWSAANAKAVSDAGQVGDVVYFSRSASATSPAATTLFWMGDQLVTWDNYDGMQSALTGMLSWGLSGMSLAHSDIGGYTMIDELGGLVSYLRTKELLMRWIELSAFSDVVFRTHPGNLPGKSWQVDSDAETLSHFARFARVHAGLWGYRQTVIEEATHRGLPHTRPMLLAYPGDPVAVRATGQFLVGDKVLVAPVLTKGAASVSVHFPACGDAWVHVWTGRVYTSANGTTTVAAPMGQPAVFVRAGDGAEEIVAMVCDAAGAGPGACTGAI